jgi:hypothetical protein
LKKLKNVSLQIQISRDGAKLAFSMMEPHVLDGFYLDIPQGLKGHTQERLMYECMSKLEPRFLMGLYPSVSESTGMSASRYRLYFLGDAVPESLMINGRMVEELVFLGRSMRVYGRGWFFRDKALTRIDLDAKRYQVINTANTTNSASQATHSTPVDDRKKQKRDHHDKPTWTFISRGKGKRKTGADTDISGSTMSLPWVSDNMFDALAERVLVETSSDVGTHENIVLTTHAPVVTKAAGKPSLSTTGQFIGGIKASRGVTHRVKIPIDTIIAELEDLQASTLAEAEHHQAQIIEACTIKHFNLEKLILEGRVDTLSSQLQRFPLEFGLQLRSLFQTNIPTFNYFVRQRLLYRWLHATWGGVQSFDQLYQRAFGVKISLEHVQEIFSNPTFSAELKPLQVQLPSGDAYECDRVGVESILALAEVIFSSNAALLYTSDAGIAALTHRPVYAVATHTGHRCLSSETLSTVLMYTDLGTTIWQLLQDIFQRSDDANINNSMATLLAAFEEGSIDILMTSQVMMKDHSPHCYLTHGSLNELWVDENRG